MSDKKSDGTRAADTLGMPEDEMRSLGYAVVDRVIEHLAGRSDETAISTATPEALFALLGGPVPEKSHAANVSLDLLVDVALRHQQHGDHPRYFARVPGPSSFAAILGDWLSVGFNSIAASWGGGSGTSALELIVIDWLRQLLGLPEGTDGLLLSGGSIANLTAIAAVVAQRGKGVVYLSDQTHACARRALVTLGFNAEEICILPSDENFRMPTQSLRKEIAATLERGQKPLMVIATAGTTNTGASDPLMAIADICATYNIWLHVDGAYGAPAALTPQGAKILEGLARADSLVLDPHKWLFQPYDTGCLLIRSGMLDKAFRMDTEYLRDVKAGHKEVDFRNRGLELTRRARAVKLWLSLRSYGVERFREAIASSIALAEYAEDLVNDAPHTWELITPAQIGIVCFALRGKNADEHERRARALSESGFACVTTTTLKQRLVLRLCIINPLTTKADIQETLARLAADPGA